MFKPPARPVTSVVTDDTTLVDGRMGNDCGQKMAKSLNILFKGLSPP
jgi:hypothetical protein